MNFKGEKYRLVSRQCTVSILLTPLPYLLHPSPQSVLSYFGGVLVMVVTVYLFATLAEILLAPEGEQAEKKVLAVLFLPLKFALLLIPFVLARRYGVSALSFFALGLFIALIPILLPSTPQNGEE